MTSRHSFHWLLFSITSSAFLCWMRGLDLTLAGADGQGDQSLHTAAPIFYTSPPRRRGISHALAMRQPALGDKGSAPPPRYPYFSTLAPSQARQGLDQCATWRGLGQASADADGSRPITVSHSQYFITFSSLINFNTFLSPFFHLTYSSFI